MATRRDFIKMATGLATLNLSSATEVHGGTGLGQASGAVSLRLSKAQPVSLSADFIGLGYEMSSVAQPGLLRMENLRYVNLIRTLGPSGVLRVGGIVANYTRYELAMSREAASLLSQRTR
jgi:hypothetical protein